MLVAAQVFWISIVVNLTLDYKYLVHFDVCFFVIYASDCMHFLWMARSQ